MCRDNPRSLGSRWWLRETSWDLLWLRVWELGFGDDAVSTRFVCVLSHRLNERSTVLAEIFANTSPVPYYKRTRASPKPYCSQSINIYNMTWKPADLHQRRTSETQADCTMSNQLRTYCSVL